LLRVFKGKITVGIEKVVKEERNKQSFETDNTSEAKVHRMQLKQPKCCGRKVGA
jgi:hypothetical protein